MSTTIETLYQAACAAEQLCAPAQLHEKILATICHRHALYMETLTEQQQEEFIEILQDQLSLCAQQDSAAFAHGFRLGAKLVMEIFEP